MAKSKFQVPPIYVGIIMFSLGMLVATVLNTSQNLSGPTAQNSPQAEAVFTLLGKDYFHQDLPYPEASALYTLDQETYEQKLRQVEHAALVLHFDQLAAARGVDRNTIRNELIDVHPITDEEVAEFYQTNQERIAQPFHVIRDAIKNALSRDRILRAEERLVEELIRQGTLVVHLTAPNAPTVELDLAGYPAKGPENAKLVVAEFADYRCPHCKAAAATLKQVQAEHPEQIRVVMLDFPILGERSQELAKAAYCADQQGRFWSYHDALFEHQDGITLEQAVQLAADQGMDTEQLSQCMTGDAAQAHIDRATRQAGSLGLTGTPAIFINGLAYRGNNLADALRSQILAALQSQ